MPIGFCKGWGKSAKMNLNDAGIKYVKQTNKQTNQALWLFQMKKRPELSSKGPALARHHLKIAEIVMKESRRLMVIVVQKWVIRKLTAQACCLHLIYRYTNLYLMRN